MSFITRVWSSSLGKKYIMAISGLILLLFLIMHMVGNLLIFLGPEFLNEYGNFLQSTPEVLWPSRITLLTMLVLHFVSAAQLTIENRTSRGVPYNEYDVVVAGFAARTMIISGFIVLFFVVYHLLHFTFTTPDVNLTGQDFHAFTYQEGAKQHHDIYKMMIIGFQKPVVSIFYILAIGLLCAHLSHGISSMFQSLGWRNNYYRKFIEKAALVFAVVLFLGYCSVPAAVLLGAFDPNAATKTAHSLSPSDGERVGVRGTPDFTRNAP